MGSHHSGLSLALKTQLRNQTGIPSERTAKIAVGDRVYLVYPPTLFP